MRESVRRNRAGERRHECCNQCPEPVRLVFLMLRLGAPTRRDISAPSRAEASLSDTILRSSGVGQGSSNTRRALPRVSPKSSGAKPFIHPPHPDATATYCFPRTL
jgi:hypothetical protein